MLIRSVVYEKKNFNILILTLIFLSSCGNYTNGKPYEDVIGDTEITISEKPATIESSITVSQIDNVREIDLNLVENSEFLQYNPRKSYQPGEFATDGYGHSWRNIMISGERMIAEGATEESGYLYLVEDSGEKKMLVSASCDDYPGNIPYLLFGDMIDENQFYYIVAIHETTAGFGIYDLATGKDYRMDGDYIPVKAIDNYLMLENGFISDIRGFGKLNLDNYHLIETDFLSWQEQDKSEFLYFGGVDFSPDGTKAAIYAVSKTNGVRDVNEYQLLIYSIAEERVLQTYNFFSINEYVNHSLVYLNEEQVFIFAFRATYSDSQDYLYIIDLVGQ